jgi:hypothetical protein
MEEASGLDRWTAHGREGGRDGMAWHGMLMGWNAMAAFSRAVEGSGLVQKEEGRGGEGREGKGRGREPNPRRRAKQNWRHTMMEGGGDGLRTRMDGWGMDE